MTTETATTTTADVERILADLEYRYRGGHQVPPCVVCGGELTRVSMGGGRPDAYAHDQGDPEHYRRSRWEQGLPADQNVLALVELYRAATAPAACVMTHTPPFDFAQCETHDSTFALGQECRFKDRDPADVYFEEAQEQRVRAVRAEAALDLHRCDEQAERAYARAAAAESALATFAAASAQHDRGRGGCVCELCTLVKAADKATR